MEETNTPAGTGEQDWLRKEIERALSRPKKPLSDYLKDYRRRIDAVSALPTLPALTEIRTLAKKSTVAKMGLLSLGLPPSHPLVQLGKQRSVLNSYTRSILPKEIQKQCDELRRTIGSISTSIGKIVPLSHATPSLVSAREFLAPYQRSAQIAQEALTPKPGSTSLSAQVAKAAIPKLVDFAEQLGNVTDVVITMKATTDTGSTAVMQQKFKVQPPRSKRQVLQTLEITSAVCNGETIQIGVPPALNRHYAAKPIVLDDAPKKPDNTQRPAVGSNVPAGAIGKYASKLVKADQIDWQKRIIVFKGRYRPIVKVPMESNGAWEYMKRLLASDHPKGWIPLEDDKDARWSGHFDRRDENKRVDANHPLTNLRCRIESKRKPGRQRVADMKDLDEPRVPMIRLAPFDKNLYESYVRKQKNAKRPSN